MTRARTLGLPVALAILVGCGSMKTPWQRSSERERGRVLFTERNCHACHSIGLLGTPTGPDLSHVGERWTRADIESWLEDPSAHDPVAHMPKIDLSDEEVSALTTFLLSLDDADASRPGRVTEP